MFTGIVEEMGQVIMLKRAGGGYALEFKASLVINELYTGDSLSVNGVCLTVTANRGNHVVEAEVMPETIRRTNLGELQPGDKINLERAMTPSTRMGGHFVTGHIDGIGGLLQKRTEGNAIVLRFSCSPELSRYLIIKGSVAIDGISLTVTAEEEKAFEVSLVPHTLKQTTLGLKKLGDKVNLEGDLLGKYVEKYTRGVLERHNNDFNKNSEREITSDFLQEKGFW